MGPGGLTRVWTAMTSNYLLLTWVCFFLAKPFNSSMCQKVVFPQYHAWWVSCPLSHPPVPPFFPPHKDKTKLLVLPSDFRVLDCGMRYFYSLLLVLRTIWYIVRQMINTSHSSSICESRTLATAPSLWGVCFWGVGHWVRTVLIWPACTVEALCMKGMSATQSP